MTAVVVTVKKLEASKHRMAPLLRAPERAALAWNMYLDASGAVAAARWAKWKVVVTADRRVIEHARHEGWQVIEERSQISESHSLDQASKLLKRQGASAILRLPADIPLIQPRDVDQLLQHPSPLRGGLLVPSRDRRGTNALLRRPPDAFGSRFGPDSFRLHRQEAEAAGVRLDILENPRIGLDLDTPADLQLFLSAGAGTRTWKLAKQMGLDQRIESYVDVAS